MIEVSVVQGLCQCFLYVYESRRKMWLQSAYFYLMLVIRVAHISHSGIISQSCGVLMNGLCSQMKPSHTCRSRSSVFFS